MRAGREWEIRPNLPAGTPRALESDGRGNFTHRIVAIRGDTMKRIDAIVAALAALATLALSACHQAQDQEETPAPPPPAVFAVTPNPVAASGQAQQLTLAGADFAEGASVRFTRPDSSVRIADGAQVQFVSPSQLLVTVVADLAGSWSVQVINPDGQQSNLALFEVVAAGTADLPRVHAISPDPVPASFVDQAVTITGEHFADGALPVFTRPDGSIHEVSAERVESADASSITYRLDTDGVTGRWNVAVRNPDGHTSNALPFTVEQIRVSKLITPGPDATAQMVAAMTTAAPGTTIEFDCGFFDLSATLLINGTEDVVIRGCGRDRTVLSFRNNTTSPEGILINNMRGITIEDLTVADSHGNGIELRSVEHATIRRVRTIWSSGGGATSPDPISADNYTSGVLQVACTDPPTQDPDSPENSGGDISSPDYTPSRASGRYGIYPVKSQHILIDQVESVGASDAGIYVGQSTNAIIRNSRAAYNVFGFEIENVQGGEYFNNLAECNTGGFLVYDLDNLTQYGSRTRMINNRSINNNTYNFSAGGIVSQIPPGSGMITLAYDRIDVIGNRFENNDTAGIIHVSYAIFPEPDQPGDRKLDFYTEGMLVRNNVFRNNGNNLQPPSSRDIENENTARVLPSIVGAKIQAACNDPRNAGACPIDETGGFRGAHIIWDGLVDEYDPDCPYPVDANGNPVPADADGKPIYSDEHPNPACHYNAYKFDTTQDPPQRIGPKWWFSCIDPDNDFSDDSVHFANFKGTKGANAAITLATGGTPTPAQLAELNEFAADFDLSPHDCPTRYGSNLVPLPPVEIPPFVPSGDFDPAPTPEEIAALCGAEHDPGEVNFEAYRVNCPRLQDYNLFADPADPRSTPNSGGVPFVLNSKLFSDYSNKYRVLFLPPGKKAAYRDSGGNDPNTVIAFPVGTIIAKTFAFTSGNEEHIVETRLLIKRETQAGGTRWAGVAYIWQDDGNGNRVAVLAPEGGKASVSWDFTDPETGVRHTGSTDDYLIPNTNQCASCHENKDQDPGSAPIGPKVRNLNRPYRSESPLATDQAAHPVAGHNQIQWWCDNGILAGCPEDLGVDPNSQVATALERVPKFNVPGDSGHPAGSDADIEARARAWLEVNCQHCHNPKGFAANTGMYLDVLRRVDASYGICKGPTATGAEGSGGRAVDIHPGDADKSILEYRISPLATSAAARMPPLARSVVDEEGWQLVRDWIDHVIVADEQRYPNSTRCTQ